jgi:hypothetical protein
MADLTNGLNRAFGAHSGRSTSNASIQLLPKGGWLRTNLLTKRGLVLIRPADWQRQRGGLRSHTCARPVRSNDDHPHRGQVGGDGVAGRSEDH